MDDVMTSDEVSQAILWLDTVGLVIGSISAILLALFTKVFITIEPNGDQSWGIPAGMSNNEWRAKNRRLRWTQRHVIPAAYLGLVIGFGTQLVALWLPSFVSRQSAQLHANDCLDDQRQSLECRSASGHDRSIPANASLSLQSADQRYISLKDDLWPTSLSLLHRGTEGCGSIPEDCCGNCEECADYIQSRDYVVDCFAHLHHESGMRSRSGWLMLHRTASKRHFRWALAAHVSGCAVHDSLDRFNVRTDDGLGEVQPEGLVGVIAPQAERYRIS